MEITIVKDDARHWDAFLGLANSVYRRDPHWIRQAAERVRTDILAPPFSDRQRVLLAWRHHAPVARVVARWSPELRDPAGAPLGMLGFFESLDDREAVHALFDHAVQWLRECGCGSIVGPMNGDTWHRYRMNLGPFEPRPFLLEPYQRPGYRELWESYGFTPLQGYFSSVVSDLAAAAAGTDAIARRCERRGYRLERITLHAFEHELDRLYALSCAIFADSYLYAGISREAFGQLYADSKPLLDPDFVWFARAPDGRDIGFVFAFPDRFEAVRAMRGRRDPLSLLRFRMLRSRADAINVKTLGVLPEARGSGVALLLVNRVYRLGAERGFHRANLCLIRDGNASARLDGGQGKLLRRYALYQFGAPTDEGPNRGMGGHGGPPPQPESVLAGPRVCRIGRAETETSNVVLLLQRAARRFPERLALVMPSGEAISFAALWDRVARAATGLQHEGIRSGDRVICMVPMSVDLYVVLLGLLKAGAVAAFVDPWVGVRPLASFAAFAEPRGFVGVPKAHLLRLLHRGLRGLPLTVTTGRRFAGLPARCTLRDLLCEPGDDTIAARTPDDPALITFTTGSSGAPKGVNRTHGFLAAQHAALGRAFPSADTDVDMPMFPVFALHNLAQGITSVVPDMDFRHVASVDPARLLAQLRAHGVTTCTASPPFFNRLAEAIRAQPATGPRLRRILTGGAPVSNEDLSRWQAAFPDTEILVVYGSTEAEPVAHIDARERLALPPSATAGYCLGRPVPDVTTRVVRITTAPVTLGPAGWPEVEVTPGEAGELAVTGAHVCKDYFRHAEAVRQNKIHDRDGCVWHRMGDTVRRDAEGRLWLVGRVHSTIWRAGIAVHPQAIEQAAREAGCAAVAAVGMPDKTWGERVVLIVSGARSGGLAELRARLAAAGSPVDDIRPTRRPLPLDPRHNSKIDYARLRDWLLKGKL